MTTLKSIGRLILQLLLGALIVLIAVFAVSNRVPVTVSFWPFFSDEQVPLYIAILGAAAVGLVAGGAICWLGKGRLWLRARSSERRAARLAQAAVRSPPDRAAVEHSAPPAGRTLTPRARAASDER